MRTEKAIKKIGIAGGGPSGLFVYKQLVEAGIPGLEITIFEKKEQLGAGMPYSREGACYEHVTNVSGNEIPELISPMKDWIKTAPGHITSHFNIQPARFNDYKVVPRLLFGEYLSSQFALLMQQAREAGLLTRVLKNTPVLDIIDHPQKQKVSVMTPTGQHDFDCVVISTGHEWPKKHEGSIPGYFDSPYPPSKLSIKANYPVAIKGASLTAIDAIRTLARQNGRFITQNDDMLTYQLAEDSRGFKLVMHSLDGLLPAIRFHLEDSHLINDTVLSSEEVASVIEENGGFLPLDYLFEKNFKALIRKEDEALYEKIRDMNLEAFVEHVMDSRERIDAFELFKAEYAEAEKSINNRESIYWKEALAMLSFAMNYPAKHLSAEDMLRLKKVLMPLISIVIAFVPQSSCRELLALYGAGVLNLVEVNAESKVMPQEKGGALYEYADETGRHHSVYYKLFIDCAGQPHLSYDDFPFKSLTVNGSTTRARLKFKSQAAGEKEIKNGNNTVEQEENGDCYLHVPGIAINDNFEVINQQGKTNNRIYIMAVPYIGGYNPDYSGLDFCEEAANRIARAILQKKPAAAPVGV